MVNLLPVSFANVSFRNRKYAIECDLRNYCKPNVLNCVRVLSSIARVHPTECSKAIVQCIASWQRIGAANPTQTVKKYKREKFPKISALK